MKYTFLIMHLFSYPLFLYSAEKSLIKVKEAFQAEMPTFVLHRLPQSRIEKDVLFPRWARFQDLKLHDPAIFAKYEEQWSSGRFEIINTMQERRDSKKRDRAFEFISVLLGLELMSDQKAQMETMNETRLLQRRLAESLQEKPKSLLQIKPPIAHEVEFMLHQLGPDGPGTLMLTQLGSFNIASWAAQHSEYESILMEFSEYKKIWPRSHACLVGKASMFKDEIERQKREFEQVLK